MRRRPLRPAASGLALALGALLTPAGCSVSQPVPERVRYVLSAEREPAEGPGAAGMLRVGRVRVAPLSERKGFVYRTGERTYETDFFHEFFAPPSTLLRDQVAAWLAAGGAFSSVRKDGGGDADWLLEGRAHQLYADLRGDTPASVLSLEFTLLSARSLEERFRRRYDARIEVPGGEPGKLVEAWSQGLADVLGQLEADLRRVTEAPAAPGGA